MNFLSSLLGLQDDGQTPWAKEQMARMLAGGLSPMPPAGNAAFGPAYAAGPTPPRAASGMPGMPQSQGQAPGMGPQKRPPAAVMSGPEPVTAPPSMGTYLAGAMRGASQSNNPLGGILGAIGGALDAGEGVNQQNQTFRLLLSKGIPEADAALAVKNPQFMQTLLAQAMKANAPMSEMDRTELDIKREQLNQMRNPAGKPTDDMAEYEFARKQGFAGTFQDYMTGMKKAGATVTNVTTDMRAESAEAKARGEGLGKRLNTVADDGIEAQKDAVTIQRLAQLSSNVDPGTKTALLDEIRNLTGVTLDPNTDNVQAFKAAVNYLAPRMRVAGSGASSDRDVSIFFRALPGLLGTPGGNQIAIETLGGLAQYRMQRADIAAAWQRGEIDAREADQRMKALPDPFADFKAQTPALTAPQAGELPTLTPEQAAKLPPGSRFKGTDGKVRVR